MSSSPKILTLQLLVNQFWKHHDIIKDLSLIFERTLQLDINQQHVDTTTDIDWQVFKCVRDFMAENIKSKHCYLNTSWYRMLSHLSNWCCTVAYTYLNVHYKHFKNIPINQSTDNICVEANVDLFPQNENWLLHSYFCSKIPANWTTMSENQLKAKRSSIFVLTIRTWF